MDSFLQEKQETYNSKGSQGKKYIFILFFSRPTTVAIVVIHVCLYYLSSNYGTELHNTVLDKFQANGK